MKNFLVLGILFLGIAFSGIYILLGKTPTSAETFLVTIILATTSWFVSALLSERSAQNAAETNANEKIDDIAWLSSKKLADQSTNFFELESYIEQTLIAKNHHSQISETDLTAIIRDLRQLRRANTGLMQDWNRVASSNLSNEINSWIEEQMKLFGELDFSYRPPDTKPESTLEKVSYLPLSARPTKTIPVVTSVEQSVLAGATDITNKGKLVATIARPSFNFTVGGKIEPIFVDPPVNTSAKLVASPANTPSDVKVSGGTGTNFDFSVHLRSQENGVMLPAGTYEFEYTLE